MNLVFGSGKTLVTHTTSFMEHRALYVWPMFIGTVLAIILVMVITIALWKSSALDKMRPYKIHPNETEIKEQRKSLMVTNGAQYRRRKNFETFNITY